MRWLPWLLVVVACRQAPEVRLEAGTRAGQPILWLAAAPGDRINARLPPAVELEGGTIIRLAQGRVTADSAYFRESPWGIRPPGTAARGTLRVSLCRDGEGFCRTVALPLELPSTPSR
jgi:hypothetical protein